MKHGRPQLGACLDLAWGGCQNKFVRWPTIALAARPVKAAGKGSLWVVCALLALAQVLTFAHVAFIAHRTCALHGEAIHAGATSAPYAQEGDVTSVLPTDTAGHEHEHCLCMAAARGRFLLSSRLTSGWSPPAMVGGVVLPFVAWAPLPIGHLFLAPKGSPPA